MPAPLPPFVASAPVWKSSASCYCRNLISTQLGALVNEHLEARRVLGGSVTRCCTSSAGITTSVALMGTRLTTPSSIILLSTALKNLDFVSSLVNPSSSALNFLTEPVESEFMFDGRSASTAPCGARRGPSTARRPARRAARDLARGRCSSFFFGRSSSGASSLSGNQSCRAVRKRIATPSSKRRVDGATRFSTNAP